MKLTRIYHPWTEWEEIRFNMWGSVSNKKEALNLAIELTGNAAEYGYYMRRVTNEWPISCENALTDYFLNRKAWLGHAAVALALQIPEDIIRAAWAVLTYEQQLLANKEAERAISAWEHAYIKDQKLYPNMGKQMLFGWDT